MDLPPGILFRNGLPMLCRVFLKSTPQRCKNVISPQNTREKCDFRHSFLGKSMPYYGHNRTNIGRTGFGPIKRRVSI